jgi:3,4-dihydroxy-9,10-secoandrosta-1,3,5(10)-triene-9,17-dione 4,5-dioxygenase
MGTMDVQSLGYLRITAEDPHTWAGFASHVLGMEAVPGDGDVLHLRMDDRHHRIAIEPANGSGGFSSGWEVADAAALDAAAGELEAVGVAVTAGTKTELESRRQPGRAVLRRRRGRRRVHPRARHQRLQDR